MLFLIEFNLNQIEMHFKYLFFKIQGEICIPCQSVWRDFASHDWVRLIWMYFDREKKNICVTCFPLFNWSACHQEYKSEASKANKKPLICCVCSLLHRFEHLMQYAKRCNGRNCEHFLELLRTCTTCTCFHLWTCSIQTNWIFIEIPEWNIFKRSILLSVKSIYINRDRNGLFFYYSSPYHRVHDYALKLDIFFWTHYQLNNSKSRFL